MFVIACHFHPSLIFAVLEVNWAGLNSDGKLLALPMNIWLGGWQTVTNTLAYNKGELISGAKSLIAQAPDVTQFLRESLKIREI